MAKCKLTPKQSLFCAEYIRTNCATEAYRKVFNVTRMKNTTIHREAHSLLKNPKIATRLNELCEQVTKEALVDAVYVLNRFVEIDQMDIIDILNDDWTLKPLSEWPKVWRTYLSSFDVQEVTAGPVDSGVAVAFLKKIKWPDKLKNLELLGKHKAVNAFTGVNDGPSIIMPMRIEIVAPGYTETDHNH